MGGIFGSSPPPPPPPPAPPPEPAKDYAAELAAQGARERRRRGQAETIATSWRGLDQARPSAPGAPKPLLGE